MMVIKKVYCLVKYYFSILYSNIILVPVYLTEQNLSTGIINSATTQSVFIQIKSPASIVLRPR